MTEARFKIGDRVYIPKNKQVTDAFRGAHGKIIEVHPGSGPGAGFLGPEGRFESSICS